MKCSNSLDTNNNQSSLDVETMNQTAPQIINVLTDNGCNQESNQFDFDSINSTICNSRTTTIAEEREKNSTNEEPVVAGVNVNLVNVEHQPTVTTANDNDEMMDKPQHRTILRLNSNSHQSKFGFIHSLRYQLEKKRNKSRMERLRKEQEKFQLKQSTLSLSTLIEDQELTTTTTTTTTTTKPSSSINAKTMVTLANTSTIEIKSSTNNQTGMIMNQSNDQNKNSKTGTLRRLFSLSSTTKDMDDEQMRRKKLSKDKKNKNKIIDESLKLQNIKHKNKKFSSSSTNISDISEPYPFGIESILLQRSSLKNDSEKMKNQQQQKDYYNNRHHQQYRMPMIKRSSSERNFRSIIRLNESLNQQNDNISIIVENDDDDGYMINVTNNRKKNKSYNHHHRRHIDGNNGESTRFGSQINLSTSSLSNISCSSQLGVSRMRLLDSRCRQNQQQQKKLKMKKSSPINDGSSNTSLSTTTSTSSSLLRQPVVTFTLPKNFKSQQKYSFNNNGQQPRIMNFEYDERYFRIHGDHGNFLTTDDDNDDTDYTDSDNVHKWRCWETTVEMITALENLPQMLH
nr:probable WRKY transcription factor protein 1 [Dermatophagoides farinae]